MEKYLYKKSYQLNSFKPIRFNDLWGKKGVFTTIRVVSPKRKFIFFSSHIANINLSLSKMNIDFKISQKMILQFLKPVFKKINNKDVLLRIAINTNIISLSLRIRRRPIKNFVGKLYFYKRSIPNIKNLYYKKIINILNKSNLQQEEIILCNRGYLLEGCTTNILCIRNKQIYIPIKNYYKGITMNYLLKNTKRHVNKINIPIKQINKYEEILLVGSGKGVVSLSSIPQINWKSKSNLVYKELLNLYKKKLNL